MHDRLLLVDDDASQLKLMSIRLEAEGFGVHTVESAESALQALRNHPFELVITDLRMNGASGLDLFEQIRHFYPGLPVIIMSAPIMIAVIFMPVVTISLIVAITNNYLVSAPSVTCIPCPKISVAHPWIRLIHYYFVSVIHIVIAVSAG